MVYIEAGVDGGSCRDDTIPCLAIWRDLWHGRELLGWRVRQGFVQEFGVSASFGALVDLAHEGVVQGEDAGEMVQCRGGGRYLALILIEDQVRGTCHKS